MIKFPRFSRFVRENANLDVSSTLRQRYEEQSRIQLLRTKCSKNKLTLAELKKVIQRTYQPTESSIAQNYLIQLTKLFQDSMVKESNQELLEEYVVLLLKLFLDVQPIMTLKLSKVKDIMNLMTTEFIGKMSEIMKKLIPLLTEECKCMIKSNQIGTKQTNTSNNSWGSNLTCNLPFSYYPIDNSKLQDISPLNPTIHTNSASTFSMIYNKEISKKSQCDSSVKFNKEWLLKNIHSDENIINLLIRMLKSSSTNDELQNDICDVIGFDRLGKVPILLGKRKIINQQIDEDIRLNNLLNIKLASTSKDTAITTTISLKTEHDKYLQRQENKDRKKLKKILANSPTDDQRNPNELSEEAYARIHEKLINEFYQ